MKLEGHKLLEETDRHFKIQPPEGSAFRVAKAGLPKKTVEQIQQHFAGGGPVFADNPAAGEFAAQEPETAGTTTSADPDSLWRRMLGAVPPTPEELDTAAVQRMVQALPSPTERPAEAGSTPEGPPEPSIPEPPSAGLPARKPAVSPLMSSPAGPRPLSPTAEITEAYQQAEAAALGKAKIEAEHADMSLRLQEHYNARREALSQQMAQRLQDWQTKSDQLFNAVQSSQIDPERIWQSKPGGKLTAAIGIILGGIGSGLTRGPNMALDTVNRMIDRDIDVQKANLGKQQSLMTYHMQQGRTLMEAQQLAAADLKDTFAGTLSAAAMKYAGPKAQQDAQTIVSQLRAQSVQARQTVAVQSMDLGLKALQAQQAQWQIRFTQAQMGVAQKAATGAPLTTQEASIYAAGDPKKAQLLQPVGDGTFKLAASEASAEKMRDLQEQLANTNMLLMEPEKSKWALVPGTIESKRANEWRDRVADAISATGTSLRWSKEKIEHYRERVPDFGSLRRGVALDRLQTLKQDLLRESAASMGARTLGG